MKVFDLFAGAGGFGLGFELAGFKLSLSLEKDDWAIDTLKLNNRSKTSLIHADITTFDKDSLINSITLDKPDVIIGGPPCQGFSIAGPTKDPNDPRNTLFREFVKWVYVYEPSVFVMENVKGILGRKNADGRKVIDIIKQAFLEIGYSTEVWMLNAAEYGVPQLRERVFIVGNKFGKSIGNPKPTHYIKNIRDNSLFKLENFSLLPAIKVSEAISDLPEIYAGQGTEIMEYNNLPLNDYQTWARNGSVNVHNHVSMKHTKRVINRYVQIQNGNSLSSLPEALKVRKRSGNGSLSEVEYACNYRHLKPDMISYTIPASFYSNFIHPNIPRNITAREAARLQSFPDHYIFAGQRTMISSKLLKRKGEEHLDHLSQYNQIGNAVPPLLSKAIATKIYSFLDQRNRIYPVKFSHLNTIDQDS